MPQYKVPQNIFMEDKIIGPLTLWQFLYLLFGGLIVYISYQFLYLNARVIFYIIAAPVSLVSLGAAFVKIHDRPLPTFVKNGLIFMTTPRERFWRKKEELEGASVISGTSKKQAEAPRQIKRLPDSDLAKLSEVLDTYGKSAEDGLVKKSSDEPKPNNLKP